MKLFAILSTLTTLIYCSGKNQNDNKWTAYLSGTFCKDENTFVVVDTTGKYLQGSSVVVKRNFAEENFTNHAKQQAGAQHKDALGSFDLGIGSFYANFEVGSKDVPFHLAIYNPFDLTLRNKFTKDKPLKCLVAKLSNGPGIKEYEDLYHIDMTFTDATDNDMTWNILRMTKEVSKDSSDKEVENLKTIEMKKVICILFKNEVCLHEHSIAAFKAEKEVNIQYIKCKGAFLITFEELMKGEIDDIKILLSEVFEDGSLNVKEFINEKV